MRIISGRDIADKAREYIQAYEEYEYDMFHLPEGNRKMREENAKKSYDKLVEKEKELTDMLNYNPNEEQPANE